MKLYRVTCAWDDVDGLPVFWAGTKRDAQRIRSYIFKEGKAGGIHDGVAFSDPDIEEVNVPSTGNGDHVTKLATCQPARDRTKGTSYMR